MIATVKDRTVERPRPISEIHLEDYLSHHKHGKKHEFLNVTTRASRIPLGTILGLLFVYYLYK